MKNLIIKIGKLHSKIFGYVSKKASTSNGGPFFLLFWLSMNL
jgi:hypothetical protein